MQRAQGGATDQEWPQPPAIVIGHRRGYRQRAHRRIQETGQLVGFFRFLFRISPRAVFLRQGRRRHASGSQQLDLTARWRAGLAAAGTWYVGFCGGVSRTVFQNPCLKRTGQCRIPHSPGEESHQDCGIRADTCSSHDGADAEQLAEPSARVVAETVAPKLADHHTCNS